MDKLLAFFLLCCISIPALHAQKIDFSDLGGPVKPVNSVGQPPINNNVDPSCFKYLQDAGVKYSRLHDVGGAFGKNLFVDIPNIFRDFDADETLEESYDFAFTDTLLLGLQKYGVEPYFRLGVTIENERQIKSYRIDPPKDFAKWARICEHIIMHYNEGWADGFHMNILHWEIWNEPDNYEDPSENAMWRGTFDQYLDLYGVTSTYLKTRFPDLMIGGYGSCGMYAITEGFVRVANSSPRTSYFLDCFHAFLERARKEGWPLDFFSCHSYASPSEALVQAEYARKKLDEYGFTKTRLSFNEWLPEPSVKKLGTARQAAEIMAEIIGFQNGSVDDAEIYDARLTGGMYAPLFEPESRKPRKAYYSFLAFNELRKLGTAVKVPQMPDGIYVAAATDRKERAAVLVSNISGKDWENALDFGEYDIDLALVIDEDNNLSFTAGKSVVRNYSIMLLYLSKRRSF